MKVVILAGGFGTRLSEETDNRPKPLVEIGGRPIIWHIMKHFGQYGFNEFHVALGYKGEMIKRFFLDYAKITQDLIVSLSSGKVSVTGGKSEDWNVHLEDTGIHTITGGRLKRLSHKLQESTFMMTYGDGVADVDLKDLLKFHKSHGKLATVTIVRPPARFGWVALEGNRVTEFSEKAQTNEGWINGGYFVLEPQVLDYIEGDATHWEKEPLEALAKEGELMAYRHEGFWQCMDTLRDKRLLDGLWDRGNAPWKIWDEDQVL